MPRKSAHEEQVPRLLFDIVEVARILNLSESTIHRLCEMGELRPSVTVGNRRLFTVGDLEKFVHNGTPKKIQLPAREEAALA